MLIFGGAAEVPGQKYDVLLIDTPPSLTMTATGAAVTAADIILIPTSPSPADIWEAAETAIFVQNKNKRAMVRIALNRTRTVRWIPLLTLPPQRSPGASFNP